MPASAMLSKTRAFLELARKPQAIICRVAVYDPATNRSSSIPGRVSSHTSMKIANAMIRFCISLAASWGAMLLPLAATQIQDRTDRPLDPTLGLECIAKAAENLAAAQPDEALRQIAVASAALPNWSTPKYYEACAHAQRSDFERALECLKDAAAKGYDVLPMLEWDSDLRSLAARLTPEQKKEIASLHSKQSDWRRKFTEKVPMAVQSSSVVSPRSACESYKECLALCMSDNSVQCLSVPDLGVKWKSTPRIADRYSFAEYSGKSHLLLLGRSGAVLLVDGESGAQISSWTCYCRERTGLPIAVWISRLNRVYLTSGAAGLSAYAVQPEVTKQGILADGKHIVAAAKSVDERRLAVSTDARETLVYELEGNKLIRVIQCQAQVLCLALSPDGSEVLLGTKDGFIRAHDIGTGEEKWEFADPQGTSTDPNTPGWLEYSPSGEKYVAGYKSLGTLYCWDTKSRRLQWTHDTDIGSSGAALRGRFSSNEKLLLVSGINESTTRVLDSDSGTELIDFSGSGVGSLLSVGADGVIVGYGSKGVIVSNGDIGPECTRRIDLPNGKALCISSSGFLRGDVSAIKDCTVTLGASVEPLSRYSLGLYDPKRFAASASGVSVASLNSLPRFDVRHQEVDLSADTVTVRMVLSGAEIENGDALVVFETERGDLMRECVVTAHGRKETSLYVSVPRNLLDGKDKAAYRLVLCGMFLSLPQACVLVK